MKSSTITTLGALVLIGAGGFMAGRISSPADPSSEADAGSKHIERPAGLSSRSESSANGERRLSSRASRSERAASRGAMESSPARLARLEALMRGENPLDRNRALMAFIDQLAPSDFEEAVASFRSLGITESRMGEYSLLLAAWAKTDPEAALAYAKANTGNRFATDTILASWASIDPESAIRWAEANHTGEGPNPHMAGIIRSLAATDPARATQLLTALPRSQERGYALDGMLPHMLAQGAEATRSWISGLDDEFLRQGAIMRSADRLAMLDPAGTAQWLLENPGEAAMRRMDNVYSAWMRMDEQAALGSLASLPSGQMRSNALRGVVSTVAIRDPAAAVSMMDRFPNDVNDRVVQNFVWHSFGSDPSAAVSQIARIENNGEREQMYRRTMDAWFRRDAEAAVVWMRNNPLPPSVVEHLNRHHNLTQ